MLFQVAATHAGVPDLARGTAFVFGVAAFNDAGVGDVAFSNRVTTFDVPAAPHSLSATAGNAVVTLAWMPPPTNGGTDITHYTIREADGGVVLSSTSSLVASLPNLDNGQPYQFTVTASNVVGEGPPSQLSPPVTPRTVPGPPVAVRAAGGDGAITLRWRPPLTNGGTAVTGYVVAHLDGGVVAATTATEARISGLTNGRRYKFVVAAANVAGTGTPSRPSNRVTPAAPCAGTNVLGSPPVVGPPGGWRNSSVLAADFDADGRTDLVSTSGLGVWLALGNGDGTFGTARLLATVGSPLAIPHAGDLDGDGDLDLVFDERDYGRSWVLVNSDGGTFGSAVMLPDIPQPIALGDFNRDGRLDLAACRMSSTSQPRIHLGLGDAGFGAAMPLPSSFDKAGLAVGDLNNDAKPDLVFVNHTGSQAEVLLGNGDATFSASPVSVQGFPDRPSAVLLVDLDLDGNRDLVVTHDSSTLAFVRLGVGNGAFQPELTFNAADAPGHTFAADVDGDGRPDLVVPDRYGPVRVFGGNGNGTFRPLATVPIAGPKAGSYGTAWGAAIADFDNNGRLDLAVAGYTAGGVVVALSSPSQLFQARTALAVQAVGAAALGDLNGDEELDLVITRDDVGVDVHLGDGDGGFTFAGTRLTGHALGAPVVADLDDDGFGDVVIANRSEGDVSVLFSGSRQIRVPSDPQPIAVALADYNVDGRADLAVLSASPASVRVLLSLDGGSFTLAANRAPIATGPVAIKSGDVNADGKPDCIVFGRSAIEVLLGDGNGGFSAATSFAAGSDLQPGSAEDFNGDGCTDAAVYNGSSVNGGPWVTVLMSNCAGALTPPARILVEEAGPRAALGAADVNGDGVVDLLLEGWGGTPEDLRLLRGRGNGTFEPAVRYARGGAAYLSNPGSVAGDLNGDGRLDVIAFDGADSVVNVLLNRACLR